MNYSTKLPIPTYPEKAEMAFAELGEAIKSISAENIEILRAVFAISPYLTKLAVKFPETLSTFFDDFQNTGSVDAIIDSVFANLSEAKFTSIAEINKGLRNAKGKLALITALADISGIWDLYKVTDTLSEFADLSIHKAIEFLFARAENSGQLKPATLLKGVEHSGLIVLAMGKLGSRELNYSSDIDLIVFYDGYKASDYGIENPRTFFIKLTQEMVNILQERTEDGYVFRVDLRLRPDPASTPLAISTSGAMTYYETVGQNWERAAMIKARFSSGDEASARVFLNDISAYVYRKNLDFAAVRDIQSIKRQINARLTGSENNLAGYDVKLGMGGIREIEFFVQTQQLIWGGRQPQLRQQKTVDALCALEEAGFVTAEARQTMESAYSYLRQVEHRLQMIDDQQTHEIPAKDADILRIANFMGHSQIDSFADELFKHTEAVHLVYSELFKDSPPLSGPGTLVFTGVENNPETLKTIARMGFANPDLISSTIRAWHHGSRRSTRTKRARELITELTPGMLEAFAKTPNPDFAFQRFDELIDKVPATAQIFAILNSSPKLMELIADITGNSIYLSRYISTVPYIIDSLIEPGFLTSLPSRAEMQEDISISLNHAHNTEEKFNVIRRFANEHKFQVAIHMLKALSPFDLCTHTLSLIAEVAIASTYSVLAGIFAVDYGQFKSSEFGIIALGKLGGQSMNINSDADLILVYDSNDEDELSSGVKAFNPNVYYIRLAQRLINAISSISEEGKLYEVDTRLRPHGNAGPLVISVDALQKYYESSAWDVEFLALTRARVILGSEKMNQKISTIIRDNIFNVRDRTQLEKHIIDLRRKIAESHSPNKHWDTKFARGGLLDIELISQYLQIRHVAEGDLVDSNTSSALSKLMNAGIIPENIADHLSRAEKFYRQVQTYRHLIFDEDVDVAKANPKLINTFVACLNQADVNALDDTLKMYQQFSYITFASLFGEY
jgi:glutamate-ammonia-ligase adenylyltransferase